MNEETTGDQRHPFSAQLDKLVESYGVLRSRAKYEDLSDLPEQEVMEFIACATAAVDRIAGPASPYQKQVDDILGRKIYDGKKAVWLLGVIKGLRHDLSAGYLERLSELIHAELFADFLEMAMHLQNEGYKDAAAVIAGSTLEAHLRQLSSRHAIAPDHVVQDAPRPKKADLLNAELAKAEAYSKLDQKSVTAWLDLRNKAAHGEYGAYAADQVSLMIAGIRDFVRRNPS